MNPLSREAVATIVLPPTPTARPKRSRSTVSWPDSVATSNADAKTNGWRRTRERSGRVAPANPFPRLTDERTLTDVPYHLRQQSRHAWLTRPPGRLAGMQAGHAPFPRCFWPGDTCSIAHWAGDYVATRESGRRLSFTVGVARHTKGDPERSPVGWYQFDDVYRDHLRRFD